MNKAFYATLLLFAIVLNIQDTNGQCSLSEFVVFDPENPGPYISCLNDPCSEISTEVLVGDCATKSHCIVHDNKCYAKKRLVHVAGDTFGLTEVMQSINSTNSTAPTTATPDNTDERLFPLGGLGSLPGQGGTGLTGLPGLTNLPGGLGSGLPGGLPSGLTGGLPGGLGSGLTGGLPGLGAGLPGLPGVGLPAVIPGLPTLCQSSFPATCGIHAQSPNLVQLMESPVNIPYCLRIPCSTSNPSLESNRFSCISVPGCYFDLGLYNLRRQYGPHRIMPGVPVCHLAIRNKKFQLLANNYVQTSRKPWMGVYTQCFINENRNEIYSLASGCYQITLMKYTGLTPRMAGWEGITSGECYLIGGCPMEGGCFQAAQLHSAQVRAAEDTSRQNALTAYNYFGQPKCLNYNPTTPQEYLDGYHQCRQAGCVVDPSITAAILKQKLYQIALTLPVHQQIAFWRGVLSGQIRADNYRQHFSLNACSNLVNPVVNVPTPIAPFSLEMRTNLGLPLGGLLPVTTTPQCPFQSYQGLLSGSITGCCQHNKCYIPRTAILRSASGVAAYRSEWSEFTACTASCGGGTRKRSRPCVRFNQNDTCDYQAEETHRCNVDACPQYGDWGNYGVCSLTCGGGTQTRTRPCLPEGSTCQEDAQGGASQSRPCNQMPCPVYSEWGSYGDCSAHCGIGQKNRTRTCSVLPGGTACPVNSLIDIQPCEVFCGSCADSLGPCQLYPSCYQTRSKVCQPDAQGGAHCRDCDGRQTYQRCSSSNTDLCVYCSSVFAFLYQCSPLPPQ
ncbi:uncharacterized protein LOC100180672 [Ciona intestinalis]